jgi:hypothetical protein
MADETSSCHPPLERVLYFCFFVFFTFCPFLETNAHSRPHWTFFKAMPIGLSICFTPNTDLPYNSTLPTTLITTSTAGFSNITRFTDNKWRRQFSSTLLRVSLRVRPLLLANILDCSGVSKMSFKSSGTRFSPSKLCFWMRRRSRPTTIWSKIGLGSSRMPCTKPTTCWMITPPKFYGDK